MNNWLAGMLDALFGTFHRMCNTIVGTIIILVVVSPSFRLWLLSQLQELAMMLLPSLLLLGIIVYAFRRMLGPLFPGGRNRH